MPQKKNPVPRIGRKDKEFKPTKKLQRKYKKVAELEREKQEVKKPKTYTGELFGLEVPEQEYPFTAPTQEEYERDIKPQMGTLVPTQEYEVNIINKIAILANEFNIKKTAKLLDVHIQELERALKGHTLTSRQKAIFTRAYYDLAINNDDIDFDAIDEYSEQLQRMLFFINEKYVVGNYFEDSFRYEVADGRVDVEKYLTDDSNANLIWMKLPPKYKQKIFEGIDNDVVDIDEMFNAAIHDFETLGDIGMHGESEYAGGLWWKWFRETFYS